MKVSKDMVWVNNEDKYPDELQKIIGLTSVGPIKGVYLKYDLMQTKDGLFKFTKWGDNEYVLEYCEKCIQMTNHLNGRCKKCKTLKK